MAAVVGIDSYLPVAVDIARRSGELRGRLAAKGEVRSQAGMLIAATAQAHGLTLVTRNARDFGAILVPILNPFAS